ncbi:energy transducer TonB [Psychroserpens damuponensis]|uniref:hypothetical protein n=1 Tax=Psychroserpens damuponensis TaxID=943936 RepID=UPI000694192F|nr:hypothetical protein [Psychroserpens damuponensis]
MDTYTQYIALINDYLNNVLSKEARLEFETKLQNDLEFNTIYQEHIIFINGLERIDIKSDIQNAKRTYYTEKWLKISGISIIIIGVIITLYTLVFNTSEKEPTPNSNTFNSIIVDSTTTQTSIVKKVTDSSKIKTIETTPEHEISFSTTTNQRKFGSVSSTKMDITKQPQLLKINVDKDTIIRCKEGTILTITKGAFINPKSKKSVSGTIELQVTEYYKLSDILLANLSTVSNGKQLETGGMLFIEAKQGSIDLELKDDLPIEVSFPSKNKKPGMQLFSGEWQGENINWSLQNDASVDDILISEEHIEELVEVPFNVVEQAPIFPGCENETTNDARKRCMKDAISKFIKRRFNTNLGADLGLSGRQQINSIFRIDTEGNIVFIQSRGSHPRLSEEADRIISLLPKMIPGKQRGKAVIVPYSLPINFDIKGDNTITGNLINKDTVSMATSIAFDSRLISAREMDTIYEDKRGMVEFIREVMHDKDFPVDAQFISEWEQYKKQKLIRRISLETKPNYIESAIILRKPLLDMANTKFKILEDDSITRGGHIIRVPWDKTKIPSSSRGYKLVPKPLYQAGRQMVTKSEFEEGLDDVTNTSISSRDVGNYVLKTSKLGWINCDRFINGRTTRIKYKLKIKNAEEASINMVFKSLNSVLPSWHTNDVYDFRTVGANENVILVAIKRKNGKLYYDTVDTKTASNPNVNFNFKEVNLEDLKIELEKLTRNSK